MHRVVPKVFLVAETLCNLDGMKGYLDHLGGGAVEWLQKKRGPISQVVEDQGGQLLTEFMGRLCYRSWKPGLNANVTKVRENAGDYLKNILEVKHGSVLEHASMSFVFADVSRVFTHELVRHRAGCAYSQESLRFVRLTDLGLWLPPEADGDDYLRNLFEQTFQSLEDLQRRMAERLGLDDEGRQFKEKKVLTSMMRRLAPEGLATTIGATFNIRSLRHVIEMRTAFGAEAEIRVVFDEIARICKERHPLLFQDFTKDADDVWAPKNSKV
jgi:thymidylate synthase (FAD)